jgi:hypothetical protein
MRKKTKWRISAVVFEKKTKIYPVLMSPTHIGFIGVKKNGLKISHLGTFKLDRRHTRRLRKRQFADGRGGEGAGAEPNHTTARKLGLL